MNSDRYEIDPSLLDDSHSAQGEGTSVSGGLAHWLHAHIVLLIVVLAVLAALLSAVCVQSFLSSRGSSVETHADAEAVHAADAVLDSANGVAADLRSIYAGRANGIAPKGKVVCIDPGHGAYADLTLTPIGPGSDQMQYVEPGGTSGVASGVDESEVVLSVGLLLRDELESRGVSVAMVRETNDVVLSSEQRAIIANESGADIFLRLHCDGADDPSLRGFSTLTPGDNEWTDPIYESSKEAAQIMHPLIVTALGCNDVGVVERSDLAGFNFCEVPSLLFEMGFMSNPEEDLLLVTNEYQQELASAIADATVTYLWTIEDKAILAEDGATSAIQDSSDSELDQIGQDA